MAVEPVHVGNRSVSDTIQVMFRHEVLSKINALIAKIARNYELKT